MRKLLIHALVLVVPALAFGTTIFSVDDSGNLDISGAFTNTSLEVNGDITLANDETIDNAVDADVQITYDDDAAVLGSLTLESENASGNMADDDSFFVYFKANDDAGNLTTYAQIDASADDVTDGSEDGALVFGVFEDSVIITPLTINRFGLMLESGEIIDNTSDRYVTIKYDDDSADLGTLQIRSLNAAGNVSANDHLDLDFQAYDSIGNMTLYAAVEGTIDDKTNGSEDGSVVLKALAAGSTTTVATFGGTAITLSKPTTASSTLGVTGAATLSSTLGVTGAATLSSTLGVTGAATFTADINANGNIVGDGSTQVSNVVPYVGTGYLAIYDSTGLVYISSGGVTNVIDADISS